MCCHKPCQLPPNDEGLLLPIHVGAAISDVDLHMQRDDQLLGQPCDNISAKNKNYCELTAVYWAWKNIKKLYPNLEYIGLCHYRRFFDFNTKPPFFRQETHTIAESALKDASLFALKEPISGCDAILPVAVISRSHAINDHLLLCSLLNYSILETVALKLYPEYKESLRHVFYQSDDVPHRNMFIMKYELFERYAQWLFNILFEFEKIIKMPAWELEKRIFGYMSENLLPLFCFHNKLSIKRRQILFVGGPKESTSLAKIICRNLSNKVRFKLNTFTFHGIQMTCEIGALKTMYKSEGIWDKLEQLKPLE